MENEKTLNDLEKGALAPPATNPDVGKPLPTVKRKRRKKAKTNFSGQSLIPDMSANAAGTLTQYKYWVGLTASCPVDNITMGVSFPKVTEALYPDPAMTGQTKRRPVIGDITLIDNRLMEFIVDRIRRTVIRFVDDPGSKEEPGTGKNMGDPVRRPRRGHVITIPSEAEVESKRSRGWSVNKYIPNKNDVPAARFMFAQLCEDQEKGNRGETYPEPLEITGLDWPED